MLHRKRFKFAVVAILALLLTVVLAPAAVAQDVGDQSPPPPGTPVDNGNGDGATPDPGGGTGPPPTNGDGTGPPPTNGDNGDNGSTNPPGNGDMGNGDSGMAPAMWPSPNAIVHHAATPIQISALGGGLRIYYVGPSSVVTGGILPTLSALAEMHPDGDAVQLVDDVHPGTGKHVSIHYVPDAKKLHVSTFYADKPPHDYNKPYIFTVDADHSVTHEAW